MPGTNRKVLAAADPMSVACPAVDGVDTLIERGRVVLLGELHGTAEGPAFVVLDVGFVGGTAWVSLDGVTSRAE